MARASSTLLATPATPPCPNTLLIKASCSGVALPSLRFTSIARKRPSFSCPTMSLQPLNAKRRKRPSTFAQPVLIRSTQATPGCTFMASIMALCMSRSGISGGLGSARLRPAIDLSRGVLPGMPAHVFFHFALLACAAGIFLFPPSFKSKHRSALSFVIVHGQPPLALKRQIPDRRIATLSRRLRLRLRHPSHHYHPIF